HARRVLRYLSDRPPGGPSEGSTPNAMALSGDGSRLYVAEADNNAVAIFDVSAEKPTKRVGLHDYLVGRLPTDWYPTAIRENGDQVLLLSGQGHGRPANPDGSIPGTPALPRPFRYDLGQLNGSLRVLPAEMTTATLAQYSRRVAAANNWAGPRAKRR